MFKDYYQILGIPLTSSRQDIKNAYRQLSLKWHPDKNPGIDVTEIMQDINEAYKILYDEESRARYDIEYQIFTVNGAVLDVESNFHVYVFLKSVVV
jgi:curved DNA-binding protein CbpA